MRLIDADAFDLVLKNVQSECKKSGGNFRFGVLSNVRANLAKMPTVQLQKEQEAVVAHWDDETGHWIEGDRNGIDPHTRTTGEMIDTFRCSWCGFYQYWKTPFCPHCGAKMEGR